MQCERKDSIDLARQSGKVGVDAKLWDYFATMLGFSIFALNLRNFAKYFVSFFLRK